MARRSAPRRAAAKVGRTITDVASIPKRLDERVRPFARALGWAGIAALAGCAWLRVAPHEDWPAGLEPRRFPVYVTVALVAASLLGWAYMQEGQARIERRIGRRAALAVFVFLPLGAAVAGWVDDRVALAPETRASWATTFRVARWVSPALVVASLWSFFAGKAVRASGLHVPRAIGYGLLLLPFVALLGALVFGFRFPWIDEPLHETLTALGGGAVALQIVLAWFVGGPG
jgi:hypothetical protein